MLKSYKKPALTFEQQLTQLSNRGLIVSDKKAALHALSSISYYRLSAYWFPFRARDKAGQVENQFVAGASFEQVIALYEFDRELRLLVMDAIERIEIAIRTQLTYHMAHAYGAFAHVKSENFHSKFNHAQWLAKLEDETQRSSDEFIRHYKNNYQDFPTIPVWMLTEVMSLGALSLFYRGLRNDKQQGTEDKKIIADCFNIHHKKLDDWLHTLTYIRNVCAHHSRLWNRELAIRPDKSKDINWRAPITPRNDRIFYVLLILRHLLRTINNNDEWQLAVNNLIDPFMENAQYRIAMGIPTEWKMHPVWQ